MNSDISLICIAEKSTIARAREFIETIASRRISIQLGRDYSIKSDDGTYTRLFLDEDGFSYFYSGRMFDEGVSREIAPIFLVGRN